MKKIKKFKISRGITICMIILVVILSIAYGACSYYLNLDDISISKNNIKDIATLKTVQNILLTVVSIFSTNLILSALIEVHSKNALITEIINNDIIASPDFYNSMSNENKEKIYKALEKNLFTDRLITNEMFVNIRKKLNEIMDDYYFESCEYIIICNVKDDYIEKEITKKVSIRSYDNEFSIKDFCVGNVSSKTIQGVETFKLLSLIINNERINLDKYVKNIPGKISNLEDQNEYDINETYIYNKVLKIFNKKPTTIVVKSKTRTTIDDKNSTFRVTKPCKSFSLNYTVNQSDKYRLAVDAFGFLDDADDSTNSSAKSNINIKFKDWIFKYDGVVVSIIEK